MTATCPLNHREIEVVRKLSHGLRAKQIARELLTTEAVVRNCTKIATRVAQAKNTTGLVAKALREGWIK